MKILSHRGYWKDFDAESNKKVAFERSFDLGFGTETDLRDITGKIVISHNMPRGDEMTFEELLLLMNSRNLPLALNIKADGQANEVERLLQKYGQTEYFTFDMSIPDLVYQSENTKLKIFTGCSDVNPGTPLLEKAAGVWLDSFYVPWYSEERINKFLEMGKKVCIVSEDLHSRPVESQWYLVKGMKAFESDDLMICTNFPEKARDFFET